MKNESKTVSAAAAQRLVDGLGAARKQLEQAEKGLAGEARKQRRALAKAVTRTSKDFRGLEKRLTADVTQLKKRVQKVPKALLSLLGIATSDELGRLSRDLSKLSRRVDTLARTQQVGAANL